MQKLRIALGISLAIIAFWVAAFLFVMFFLDEGSIPDYTKDDGKVSIVATIYPLAWMSSELDPAATVTTIVGPGLEPHDFSPTIDDVKKIHDAELLIVNGGIDSWIDDSTLERNFPTIDILAMLQYPETDPHVWLDPILMQRIVESIGGQLELIDPKNAGVIRENVSKKLSILQGIDEEYRTGLASCSIPEIVSSHDAFSFLAKRYGFTVYGITGFSSESEPSPSKLVELTDLIRSRHISTVFFEELASDALSKTLAAETGAKVDVLDAIESLSSEESERLEYPGIMEKNLAKLKTAMVCQE